MLSKPGLLFKSLKGQPCFSLINDLHPKLWRVDLLLEVLLVAAVWHVSIMLFERFIQPSPEKPPLSKLLRTAEAEILRFLKSELLRKGGRSQKLSEIERRLEEIENNNG